MTTTLLLPAVAEALAAHGIRHEVLECSEDLADTAQFCEHYGFTLEESANTIVVASKKAEPPVHAVCIVLGTTRLDVNGTVRRLMGVKKASFADAETTSSLTGMLIGGVTAPGIEGLPVYVDRGVLEAPRVVMGGGNRTSKIVLDPAELHQLPGVQVIDGLAKPAKPAQPTAPAR